MEEDPMAICGWESCPEEIIRKFLKLLSLKCLVSCMMVNKRWKNIVLDFIEGQSLWPNVISETMANKSHTYQSKSLLSYKDILMNSMLWPFVSIATITLHHTYPLPNITKMHVYKENLILKVDKQMVAYVRYFNIANKQLTRTVESPADEIDYTENDYMFISFGSELRAYGKASPNDTRVENLRCKKFKALVYRLVDNVCYVFTRRNIIWALTWNWHDWDVKARGRYYGNTLDTIYDINEFNGSIYLVSKFGFIVCEDQKFKSFHKVHRYSSPVSLPNPTIAVLFNQNCVAMSVNNSQQRATVCQESESNCITLKCGNMTCVTEHGEVMFIGYEDGAVAIYLIQNMPVTHGQPDRLFYVQDFDTSIEEPSVLALDVFEDKLSHHLFVATRRKVLQLLITYPDQLKAYYE